MQARRCSTFLMPSAFRTSIPRLLAPALAIVLAISGVAALTSEAKTQNSTVLGVTKDTPKPLCPKDCSVTGTVTGFGALADGQKGLYRIPQDGHIVAWSVDLSKPTEQQQADLGQKLEDKKYGTDSVGRLAILKKTKKSAHYKLTKQTPVAQWQDDLGRKPIYTLKKPLKVHKGQIAALTMPTWAPLWTNQVSGKANAWKASRKPDACSADEVLNAKPQRKGTTREYGCLLSHERILYWAYFVPSEGKSGGGKHHGGGKSGKDRRAIRAAAVSQPSSGAVVPVG